VGYKKISYEHKIFNEDYCFCEDREYQTVQVNLQLENLLQSQSVDADGIYSGYRTVSQDQAAEMALRERVAAVQYDNYLDTICLSHSIPVMDREVDRFLLNLPHGALILDIGGCWGWHWRRLAETRPDAGLVIIDFVRSNLLHAKNVLEDLVGRQVVFMQMRLLSHL